MKYKVIEVEKPNSKGEFSKKVVIFMLLFLLFFTLANMLSFYITKNEQSTLITCVFGFCGAEGGYLAFVKKLKNGTDKKEKGVAEDEHTSI